MGKRTVPKKGAVPEQASNADPAGPAAAGPVQDGSVDRIRDILFGVQMQAYESRFAALEKRIEEAFQKLSADFEGRLLEGLEGEAKQRSESCSTLRRELKAARDGLESRIEQAEQKTAEAISQTERALSEALQQSTEGLQQGKAGRQELSGLLEEMARRLAD